MSDATRQFIAQHSPFANLDSETLELVVSAMRRECFAPGSRLVDAGSGLPQDLFVVVEGKVRVNGDDCNPASNSWTIEEGGCFPIGALIDRRASANSYVADDNLVCYLLPARDFYKLLEISTAFARHCGKYLSSLLDTSQRNLQASFARMSAEQQSLATELRHLIKRPPISAARDTPLRATLESMARNGIGSMIITDRERRPVGIFTQSDVLKRVALPEVSLQRPVGDVMSVNLVTLPETAQIYDAMFAMADHGVRHVLIVDQGERLTGVVSERDLFALQRIGIGQLRRAIESAPDVATLARSLGDVRQLAFNMLAQGIGAAQLTRFISALNDAVTRRVIDINRQQHPLDDIEWAWLAFGSEGREEQTLSTDQDNGIVFRCETSSGTTLLRTRLLAFAGAVNADLDRCGFPLCKGNIMAGNPAWCLSLSEWQSRFSSWIRTPEPKALLNATIFFDFRPLYGEVALAREMHDHLFSLSRANSAFQKILAGNALDVAPPLGLIRDFATESENGGEPFIDLKKYGARLFVDAARVYSLAYGIEAANTVTRLRAASQHEGRSEDNEALIEAFNFIQLLRLRHQHLEAGQGRPGDNRVVPGRLNQLDRRILKEAFRQARLLQQRLKLNYQM